MKKATVKKIATKKRGVKPGAKRGRYNRAESKIVNLSVNGDTLIKDSVVTEYDQPKPTPTTESSQDEMFSKLKETNQAAREVKTDLPTGNKIEAEEVEKEKKEQQQSEQPQQPQVKSNGTKQSDVIGTMLNGSIPAILSWKFKKEAGQLVFTDEQLKILADVAPEGAVGRSWGMYFLAAISILATNFFMADSTIQKVELTPDNVAAFIKDNPEIWKVIAENYVSKHPNDFPIIANAARNRRKG